MRGEICLIAVQRKRSYGCEVRSDTNLKDTKWPTTDDWRLDSLTPRRCGTPYLPAMPQRTSCVRSGAVPRGACGPPRPSTLRTAHSARNRRGAVLRTPAPCKSNVSFSQITHSPNHREFLPYLLAERLAVSDVTPGTGSARGDITALKQKNSEKCEAKPVAR